MALLKAALVAARSSFSAIPSIRSSDVRSIPSITIVSKRRFSSCSGPDIEDSGGFRRTQKKTWLADLLLHRFRKKGLAVTDITATTLDDVVRYYRNTWSKQPPAHYKLLLR